MCTENDCSAVLRYCGWLTGRHGPGFAPELTLLNVFGCASLSETVEAYMNWLLNDRGCKASSCANYLSGLCACSRPEHAQNASLYL